MKGKVDMFTSLSNHTEGRQHALLITAFSWTVLCGYHGKHKQSLPTTALVKQAKLRPEFAHAVLSMYRFGHSVLSVGEELVNLWCYLHSVNFTLLESCPLSPCRQWNFF